jgi:hypothetical protein
VFFLTWASTAAASASSFPRAPGTSFIDVQYSYYESGTFITPGGQNVPAGCTFEKHEASVYAEVGVTKRDTLTGQLPYDWIDCGGNRTQGFTDLEVGLDHNLHRGATTTFGVRLDAIVPTGYSIDVNPRLGYGRLGTEADVLYGGSIGRFGFYDTQTGVRFFSGYPATQFRTTGTIGYNARSVLLLGEVDYETNIGAGTTLANIGANPLIQPSYTALQGTLAATVRVAPAGSLYLGTTSLIAGRNTGLGHSIAAGFWATF